MIKKNLKNKLNNQNGVTSAEAVIAMLIIITTLAVIAMIYMNLVTDSRETDRKAGATRIATNIIENISKLHYEQIDDEVDKAKIEIKESSKKIFNTTIPNGYSVILYSSKNDAFPEALCKDITVKVNYTVLGKKKSVSFTKTFYQERVRECNSPQFGKEYLTDLGIEDSDNVIFSYSENPSDSTGPIVCPVKYNGTTYEIIDSEDDVKSLWYSYSNHQWARLLILTPTEYNTLNANPSLISSKLKGENSYVWIPRFGVEKAQSVYGSTFFKYKATDYRILNSFADDSDTLNYYVDYNNNIFNGWANDRGEYFEDGKFGKWDKYSEITNYVSNAYILNLSQYGPLFEY